MRLNNRNRAGSYHLWVVLSAIFLALGCAVFLLELLHFDILNEWQSALVIILPAIFALITYLRGPQIFEYDSDGEALNFRNTYVPSFQKIYTDEFPKYKLMKFEIIDALLLRRLYVTVTGKRGLVTLKYDISYLRPNEVKALKMSLNKVLKSNKETETRS